MYDLFFLLFNLHHLLYGVLCSLFHLGFDHIHLSLVLNLLFRLYFFLSDFFLKFLFLISSFLDCFGNLFIHLLCFVTLFLSLLHLRIYLGFFFALCQFFLNHFLRDRFHSFFFTDGLTALGWFCGFTVLGRFRGFTSFFFFCVGFGVNLRMKRDSVIWKKVIGLCRDLGYHSREKAKSSSTCWHNRIA